ncbi:MAG: hypothetical protein M3N23_00105 [Pseudomonadota bacterium]|nr:hypothetical protein [Pseudomonadota bacterium]
MMLLLALLSVVLGLSAVASKRTAQQRRLQAEDLMETMLGDFADKLRPLGRLELLESVTNKAMQYLAASTNDDESTKTLTQRAKALQVVGEVRRERGQVGGAEQAFVAAYSTLLSRKEHGAQDVEVLKNLGSSAFWLGQSRLEQNDWKAALEWFTKYREYSDKRSEIEPQNVDGWIEQSYAHNSLGTLAQMQGDLKTAEKEFLLSIGLKSKALARQPENRTLSADLADSLSWHGGALEALGHLDDAMTAYRKEIEILRALRASQSSDLAWTYSLAEALHRTAVLQRAQGADDLALTNLREAAVLLTPIVHQDPGNRLWQKALAFIELDIARNTSLQSSNELTLHAFETAFSRLDSIITAGPNNVEWVRTRELSRALLARELLRNQRPSEGADRVAEAISNLQIMLGKNKRNRETREHLGQALLVSAEINKRLGNSVAAASNCRDAAQIIASVVPGSADYKTLDPWVRANYCAGTPTNATSQRAQLAQMRYRDRFYLASFTRNP